MLLGNPDELLRLAAERLIPRLETAQPRWWSVQMKQMLLECQPGVRAQRHKIREAMKDTVLLFPEGWLQSQEQILSVKKSLAAIRANTGASLVTCDDWVFVEGKGWRWRQKPTFDPIFDQTANIGLGPMLATKSLFTQLGLSDSQPHTPKWREQAIRLANAQGGHEHFPLPLVKARISTAERHLYGDEPNTPTKQGHIRKVETEEFVSILIPTAGSCLAIDGERQPLVRNCIMTLIERSTHRNLEFILIDGGELSDELIDDLRGLVEQAIGKERWKLIRDENPYTYSSRINAAASAASGDYLLQLNDDTEMITADGIKRLVHALDKDNIGIAGALLMYPSGRVQHAGTSIDNLAPRHAWAGCLPENLPWGTLVAPRMFNAVTAAVCMCRQSLWSRLNGMTDDFPVNYNDVDFCLRAAEAGQFTVLEPRSRWIHYESASREIKGIPPELERFREVWGNKLGGYDCIDMYCSAWRKLLSAPLNTRSSQASRKLLWSCTH